MLVFAAGIPAGFEHFDFVTIVVGYVIMRVSLVAQSLRAAAARPEGRAATARYAAGITVIQLCWIGWLNLSGVAQQVGPLWLTFLTAVLMLAVAATAPLLTLPVVTMIMVVLLALLLAYYLTKGRPPVARQPRSPPPP